MRSTLLLVCVMLAAAWTATTHAAKINTTPHNTARAAPYTTDAASASSHSASRTLLESAVAAEPTASEITLTGCQLTGFTLTTHLGPDPASPPFQLLLDTTLPSLFVADSTIQCSKASNCAHITPKFAASAAEALGTVTTTYPDSSKWSGTIYAEPVEIRSSAAASAGSAAVTSLPSLRFASLTSVLHSARGDFFKAGSCAAPLDSSVTSYQGVAGFARGGGVAVAAAVSVASSTPAAEADSLWEQIRTRSTPALPSSNAFTLSLCADSGRLWLGASVAPTAAEHDRFLSLFASQMRFVRMHAEYTGLYQLDVQSIMVQPRVDSVAPAGANATVPLLGVSSVLDSTASHWIMPGAVFDSVQAMIASNPEFIAAFPSLNPNWWIDRVCVQAAAGLSSADLYRSLPRLVLKTTSDTGDAGFGVSVGAVGSYLVPCDAAHTTWAAGITRRDESVQSLQSRMSLGWPFLNHFVVHFDLAQQFLGFAASTACWTASGGSGGSESGGWDGAGSSGAVVFGGWPGSCGTGAVLGFSDPACAPRDVILNSTATHCSAVTLSAAEQQQGWTLGSCGAEIAEGESCQLSCAQGYTDDFSTAFWCERSNHTLTLSHGTQLCLSVRWEPLDPALPADGSSLPWTVPSDYPVQLNWSMPAVPFALQVDLVWVASDSGRAPAALSTSLLNSTLFSLAHWSAGPTLQFRAPIVASSSIFRVQASVEGRVDGIATMLLKVLPLLPEPTPPETVQSSSTAAEAAASSSGAAESSSPDAGDTALSSSAAASSSSAAATAAASSSAAVASSTAADAASASSSTAVAFDPRLVAASVFLDTSLLYSEVSKDESLYLASLLAELSAIVPGPRIADLRVAGHTEPAAASFVPTAADQHARFSFVLRPADPSRASSDPSVSLLLEALSASYPAPKATGLVSSKVTRVSSAMIAACDDGGFRVDCATVPEEGVSKGPAPATDRSWIYAVITVAAGLALVFCCCLLRGRGSAVTSDGSGSHVRVTSALPSTKRSKKQKNSKPAAPAVRKHEGERFTIVDGDDEDLDAFEDEDELEMEELPTEDRTSQISIAINEPGSAQHSPRPPSPSYNVSASSSPSTYGGAPSRIAPPPPALHHDDIPDFEMDAASDDEDELNQL